MNKTSTPNKKKKNADGSKKKDEDERPALELVISGGIHPASSESWGKEACARIFSHIVEANDGRAQQIVENKTYFLELYSKAELEKKDDLGMTLPYIAVYHDRPDMLRYLYARGLDLAAMCDPMSFGNPMFYAVGLKKYRCVDVLDLLGVSVNDECDMLHQTPMAHALRMDDPEMISLIESIKDRSTRVSAFFYKNFLRAREKRLYAIARKAIITIQRVIRGKLGRKRFLKKLMKKRKKENRGNRKGSTISAIIDIAPDAVDAGGGDDV